MKVLTLMTMMSLFAVSALANNHYSLGLGFSAPTVNNRDEVIAAYGDIVFDETADGFYGCGGTSGCNKTNTGWKSFNTGGTGTIVSATVAANGTVTNEVGAWIDGNAS